MIGNITHCQTPEVLKQAALDLKVKDQLSPDMIDEVRIQMEAWNAAIRGETINGYVQSLGVLPFYVTMFTERQANLYLSATRRPEGCVLHLDSTGTVVRKIPEQKQPYLYSVILADDNIPVLEFISTDHRGFSIRHKLDTFLAEVRKLNNGRPALPRVVVTDFSYALINAVLDACNTMTLTAYLKATYQLLLSNKRLRRKRSMTFIAICNAHMLKAIANRYVTLYY